MGSSRSQLHARPSGADAISDNNRSRTGSPSTLNAVVIPAIEVGSVTEVGDEPVVVR